MGQVTVEGRALSGKVAVLEIRCQLLNAGAKAKVTACTGGHMVHVEVGGEPLGEPLGCRLNWPLTPSHLGPLACDRWLLAHGGFLPSVFEHYLVPRPLSSSWPLLTQTFVQIPSFLFPCFLSKILLSCFCWSPGCETRLILLLLLLPRLTDLGLLFLPPELQTSFLFCPFLPSS